MSYLLFMDESGHDHRHLPYEVRGGIAIHAYKVWAFAQQMRELELRTFGAHLHDYHSEIKGENLLDKDRFRWAAQLNPRTNEPYLFVPEVRRNLSLELLERGKRKEAPGRLHFSAYGQACLDTAEKTLHLLKEQNAGLFAVAIPRGSHKPPPKYTGYNPDHLRKDQVYLFERYTYFLEEQNESGLLVMDQVEKADDRKFGQRIARYFAGTTDGRRRAERVVPVPLFVTSDMSYAIQAADLCIYALNVGFRLPTRGMNAPVRLEVAHKFGHLINDLQWRGRGRRDDEEFASYGIVYVEDPYATPSP